MTDVEFLIIGQGISGSCVARCLQLAGRSFMMIDNGQQNSASRVAAGVINPVTGRRIVKTWMIDQLMPFAKNFYEQMSEELGANILQPSTFVDFFPTPQMLLAFRERMLDGPGHLAIPDDQERYRETFNYDFGFGIVSPCFTVNLRIWLPSYRKILLQRAQLRETHFDPSQLQIDKKIIYQDIRADKIIFCDGIHAAHVPWFKNLPFAFNKGEALIIGSSADLPASAIFKKGLTLVPHSPNHYWVGSSYEWNFEDDQPTHIFRERTVKLLQSWMKEPFTVVDHFAAVRPATIERRPFVGVHPHHPGIAICNGMGTKGCSLAPYFADQLVNQLLYNIPVQADVSIDRFRRVLH